MAIKQLRLPSGDFIEYDDEEMNLHEATRWAIDKFPGMYGVAPPVEEPSAWRRVPDVGIAALKGAVGTAEAGVGLLNIPTGGAAGKGLESVGVRFAETQKILDEAYSPQQQAANAALRNADGFLDTLAAAGQNPSAALAVAGESVLPMLLGGVVGRGAKALGAGELTAASVGEAVIGAGSMAEQVRQLSPTGDLGLKQTGAALGAGAVTGVLGRTGGALGRKFGLDDIDVAVMRGELPKLASKGFASRVIGGGITEGVFEEMPQSSQEQMWQNYATDKPIMEGVPEAAAMGVVTGGIMGAGINVLRPAQPAVQPPPAPPAPPPAAGLPSLSPTAPPLPPAGPPSAALEAKAQLDELLAEGELTQDQYNEEITQLGELGLPPAPPVGLGALRPDMAAPPPPLPPTPPAPPSPPSPVEVEQQRQQAAEVERQRQVRVDTLKMYGVAPIISDGNEIGVTFAGKPFYHGGDGSRSPELDKAISSVVKAELEVRQQNPDPKAHALREAVLAAVAESGLYAEGKTTPAAVTSLISKLNLQPGNAVSVLNHELQRLEEKKGKGDAAKAGFYVSLIKQLGGQPKQEVQDAVQIGSTKKEVSSLAPAGQTIAEGGEGMGQGEQGTQVAQEGKTEEVTAPSPVYNEQGEITSGGRTQEELKAQFDGAAARLTGLLTRNARTNIVPEEDVDVMRELTAMLDAAIGLGHISLKQAAKYVLDSLGLNDNDLSPDLLKKAYTVATKQRGVKSSRGAKGAGEGMKVTEATQAETEGAAPQLPTDSTQLAEFENDAHAYLTKDMDPVEMALYESTRTTESKGTTSLRALAKNFGVSHTEVANRAKRTEHTIRARAKAMGISMEEAERILGMEQEKAVDTAVGVAAFEGGRRSTAQAESDDFVETHGFSRDEDSVEAATADKVAAGMTEEQAHEDVMAEIDKAATLLDTQVYDVAESALTVYDPATVDGVANEWGEGFSELPTWRQLHIVRSVVKLGDTATSVEDFVEGMSKILGEKNGPRTGVTSETVSTNKNMAERAPAESAGRGAAIPETGIITGDKGIGTTKVEVRKKRVIEKPEEGTKLSERAPRIVYEEGDAIEVTGFTSESNPKSGVTWYADTQDAAKAFAAWRGTDRKVRATKISIQNPAVFSNFGFGGTAAEYKASFLKAVEKFGGDRRALFTYLKSNGHDGVVIEDSVWLDNAELGETIEGVQYIVFGPELSETAGKLSVDAYTIGSKNASGAVWYADSKEAAEAFKTHSGYIGDDADTRPVVKVGIKLSNPRRFDSHMDMFDALSADGGDMDHFLLGIKRAGYDGMVIGHADDMWLEGEDVTATGVQYAVFKEVSADVQFSETAGAENPISVESLTSRLKALFRAAPLFDKIVKIYATQAEAKADGLLSTSKGRVQGFKTTDGKIGLIAENIEDGQELGVFLHEVGVHLGMEKLIGKANMAWLDKKIQEWAKKNDGSPESLAAKEAVRRSEKSTTDDNAEGRIAYMVEELVKNGITPQAVGSSPSHVWFRRLWAAAKVSLRKLGFKRTDFSGQNLIDLAYGAAHIELEGTWHGTAAEFRKFHHAYMGSGEGVQAYGWGTYLAQREGIGREYMKQDVRRKVPPTKFVGDKADYIPHIADLMDRGSSFSDAKARMISDNDGRLQSLSASSLLRITYEASTRRIQRAKAEDYVKPEVEGSLMRVASSVREDEFLDWDKPLSEQSEKVKEALKEEFAYFPETAAKGNGADMYWRLSKGMGEVNTALSEAEADKATSKYLDSIGIKGIKFLDAASRGQTKHLTSYDRKQEIQDAAKADDYLGFDDFGAMYGAVMAAGLEKSQTQWDMSPALVSEFEELITWKAAPIEQTRNLVIFNDKNIVRAVTYPGGKKDAPQFSEKEVEARKTETETYGSEYLYEQAVRRKKKKGYTLASMEKLPSGEVEVRWLPPKEGAKLSEVAPRTIAPDSPSKGVWEKAGAAFDRFFNDPMTVVKEHGLGWLSMDHLVEVAQGVNDKLVEYRDVSRKMQAMSKEWVYKAAKIDAEWGKLSDVEAKNLSGVMRSATRAGFDPETGVNPSTPNELKIKSLYAKLTPAAAKVYKAARDHYTSARVERQRIASGVLAAAHESLIKSAKESGDKAKLAKAEAKLKSQLEKLDEKYRQVKGPYFPLMRLGKWYVVGMSKELAALEAIDEPSKSDQAKIAAMRSTEKHYTTSSYETKSQAKAAQKILSRKYAETRFNRAEEKSHAAGVLSAAGLQDVEQYINSSFDKEVASEIRTMMAELYYEALPEHHALKHEMKREGVHGEEEDMRRVFAVSTIKSSHYMSRLKYADDLRSSLFAIRREGKKSSDAMQYYNEVVKRAKLSMDETSAPWADKVAAVSYLAHLGLNPAFVLTNASQVAMITAPWLAARTSVGKATAALGSAYRVAGDLIVSSYSDQGWRAELDWEGKVPEGVADMLTTLLKRNLLDITIEHDLGATAELKHHALGDALKIGNLPVHITELANRAVTAIAAYNLAINELKMDQAAAEEFASKAVSTTQLDYSALNAPRHMQRVFGSAPAARIVMQFRKYQQGMLWLIGRSIYNALKGASPEEKREARRTLYGLFTTTGVMAGSLGMPLAGTATWVLTALAGLGGDDDEPWDARTEYLNWLTEVVGKDAAIAIAKGIPAWMFGVDLEKRLGMGDIASPLPFMRQGKDAQESAANALLAAAGAPVATMVDIWEGVTMMGQGDWWKGAEKVVPLKGIQNLSRGARYSMEGMTEKDGDLILPPEAFSAVDIGAKMAGFATTKESIYYEATAAVSKARQAAQDVRKKLLAEIAQTRIAGDPTDTAMKKIREFNSRHLEKGIRIDGSSIAKAVGARRQAARERGESGLVKNKQSKPFLKEASFAE